MALGVAVLLAVLLRAAPALAAAPTAPTNVTASPATAQAQINWSAPGNNGGSAIASYTITPYIGSTAQTPVVVNNGSAVSAVVTGLTNGTAYTFTVKATNATATGPESTPSSAITPWNTIYDFGTTPSIVDSGDSAPVELGVKFTSTVNGAITGIRFYKAATNTGTHIASLWTATGELLASATVTNETASGWQYVMFPGPVAVTAGTTYVAGYFAPNGHYSATVGGLTNTVTNAPLSALTDPTPAATASIRLGGQHVPDQQLHSHPTGSTSCSHSRPRRRRPERRRA